MCFAVLLKSHGNLSPSGTGRNVTGRCIGSTRDMQIDSFGFPLGEGANVQAQGREAGLPAKRPSGAIG